MDMHKRLWLVFLGAVVGMGILASCSLLIPGPKTTIPPSITAPLATPVMPPSGGPPTVAPLPTASTQPAASQEALPGLTGKWIDPDSSGGGTVSTIAWQNGTYMVTSVINSSRGQNEIKKSSWSNGVLTWTYCPADMQDCIIQTTVSLEGDKLIVNWVWSSGNNSGTSTLQRQP